MRLLMSSISASAGLDMSSKAPISPIAFVALLPPFTFTCNKMSLVN